MSTGPGGIIRVGADCWITANNITNVTTGLPLNCLGFTVAAVARARWQRRVLGRPSIGYRWHMNNPVVSTWSTTPTGTQGQATTGSTLNSDGTTSYWAQLHVTPTQTQNWRWPLVNIQAEMTDPVTGYVARVIDQIYEVDFEAVSYPLTP
ncbi:MAG: hypothetical protein ACRDQU_00815 [Pseudonocardiaceae bacterium]